MPNPVLRAEEPQASIPRPDRAAEAAPAVAPETDLAAEAAPAVAPEAVLAAEAAPAAPETDLAAEAAPVAPETDHAAEAAPVAPETDLADEAAPVVVPAMAVAPEVELAGEAGLGGRRAAPITRTVLAPPAQLEVDAPARSARIYGTAAPESRVVLRARNSAWVHVSSTNNDYLWVQTLRPGDRFLVPARPDLVLWTGNAGGVEVLVDGALLPPLGPDAVVVRDVSLQPRALLRRLLPLPEESAEVSDLASAAKPPMMPPSSR
jgi:cytoskeleton protein RodZ